MIAVEWKNYPSICESTNDPTILSRDVAKLPWRWTWHQSPASSWQVAFVWQEDTSCTYMYIYIYICICICIYIMYVSICIHISYIFIYINNVFYRLYMHVYTYSAHSGIHTILRAPMILFICIYIYVLHVYIYSIIRNTAPSRGPFTHLPGLFWNCDNFSCCGSWQWSAGQWDASGDEETPCGKWDHWSSNMNCWINESSRNYHQSFVSSIMLKIKIC